MAPIDPLDRWREFGEKPDYAGLLTFSGVPYVHDPAELAGSDVAIVGAPTDDLVSGWPGTRFAPRAIRAAGCPPGPHLEAGLDGLAELRVVDFGDAPVQPADAARSHEAIERTVGHVVGAGAVPIVLGGDHAITEPSLRACARARGPLALVHSTPTRTRAGRCSASRSPTARRCTASSRPATSTGGGTCRSGCAATGPGEAELTWEARHGITTMFMHDVRDRRTARVTAARRGTTR